MNNNKINYEDKIKKDAKNVQSEFYIDIMVVLLGFGLCAATAWISDLYAFIFAIMLTIIFAIRAYANFIVGTQLYQMKYHLGKFE